MALTARTIAYQRTQAAAQQENFKVNDMTAHNVKKVTHFRKDGPRELKEMVNKFERLFNEGDQGVQEVKKKRVYHENPTSR